MKLIVGRPRILLMRQPKCELWKVENRRGRAHRTRQNRKEEKKESDNAKNPAGNNSS
jgi:hypothetical protein